MQVYGAPEEIVEPVFGDFYGSGKSDTNGYLAAEQAYITAVADWVVQNGDTHPLAGQFVSVPYADGRAQYVIGKFNGKVSLIVIETGDAWRDGRFERTATVAELKRMVEAQRSRAALFASRWPEAAK